MKRSFAAILCLALMFAVMLPMVACDDSENIDSQIKERNRLNSPLLGLWTSTSDAAQAPALVQISFNQDGTVTSRYPDGQDALAAFVSVTWDYDVDSDILTMKYVDIRGMETEYTFSTIVTSENYVTLVAEENSLSAVSKIVLTR